MSDKYKRAINTKNAFHREVNVNMVCLVGVMGWVSGEVVEHFPSCLAHSAGFPIFVMGNIDNATHYIQTIVTHLH